MEKTYILQALDQSIRDYFEQNNYAKKDNLFCFESNKQKTTQFYKSMNDHFLQNKMKQNLDSNRNNNRMKKVKSQILINIRNPLVSCVPQAIKQSNLININQGQRVKMHNSPMFSEVETSKKYQYAIAPEVKTMLSEDIYHMFKEKQERNFRKKFPLKSQKASRASLIDSKQTENLIKQYNRYLTNSKISKINTDNKIKLFDKKLIQSEFEQLSNQNHSVLSLFKKLYIDTKSQNINQNLLAYVTKFQLKDKLSKKLQINEKRICSSKNNSKSAISSPKSNHSSLLLNEMQQSEHQSVHIPKEKIRKKSNFLQTFDYPESLSSSNKGIGTHQGKFNQTKMRSSTIQHFEKKKDNKIKLRLE